MSKSKLNRLRALPRRHRTGALGEWRCHHWIVFAGRASVRHGCRASVTWAPDGQWSGCV